MTEYSKMTCPSFLEDFDFYFSFISHNLRRRKTYGMQACISLSYIRSVLLTSLFLVSSSPAS
jgi:hypothetical protein